MKQRVEEMEREAKKLRELQAAAESENGGATAESDQGVPMETEEDKSVADGRSVFVGNVLLFLPPTSVMTLLMLYFLGGLRGNPGRNSIALPGLRDYQSCNYSL